MTRLDSWVTTMGVALALGLFIDFYIGKPGQKKVKVYLESLWISFSYASVSDIVRGESRLAETLLTRLFGPKLFTAQRLVVLSALLLVVTAIVAGVHAIRYGVTRDGFGTDFGFSVAQYASFLVRASLSISLSLYLAKRVAKSHFSSALFGALIFLLLLVVQGLITLSPFAVESHGGGGWKTPVHQSFILAIQRAMTDFDFDVSSTWSNEIANIVLQPISLFWGMWLAVTDFNNSFHNFPKCQYLLNLQSYWKPYLFWGGGLALECTDLGVSLLRLAVVAIFSITLFLYPLRKFFMNLWLRVLESDKPVFTVVFGGIAALFKTSQELVKLF